MLTGCSQRMFTPVISSEFTLNAVYRTGDFSYNCIITKDENSLTIEPTSTKAEGLKITYNGKEVVIGNGKFEKSFAADEIDSSNPAKLLFGVFESIENAEVKRVNSSFQYVGKTALGDFVLVQNDDNSYESLSIPNADIEVNFVDK